MVDSSPLDADLGPDLRAARTPAALAPDMAVLQRELEALYASHFGKLAGYFRRSGLPEAVAHELAQDSFINALRGLPQFQGQSKLSTWLWSIARNVLLVHLRGTARTDAAEDPEVDPDSLTTSEPAHLTETRDCVRRAFEAFTRDHPERAQVVYLAMVEGWTRAELADFLGRSEHAATEYLSQCKARLRPYLEPCHGC